MAPCRRNKAPIAIPFGSHIRCIQRCSVGIRRERILIVRIRCLRCGPGSIGDRVLDNRSGIAIVGIERYVTIYGEHCRKAFTESLTLFGTGFTANVDGICVHADVTITQVVYTAGGDHIAGQFAVGVVRTDFLKTALAAGHLACIDIAGLHSGSDFSGSGFLELDVLDLGCALEIILVRLKIDNLVLILDELVGACAKRLTKLCLLCAQIAEIKSELVIVIIILGSIAIVMHRSNGKTKDRIDRRSLITISCYFDGVVIDLLDAADIRNTSGSIDLIIGCQFAVESRLQAVCVCAGGGFTCSQVG